MNGRKRITLLASLLFAIHPIHVESVTSIVGRADVAAALFYLLALFFYIKFIETDRNENRYLYCTFISATLSMLTKEHGITCLIVCLVYHLFIVHRFYPFSKDNWYRIYYEHKYVRLRKGILNTTIVFLLLTVFRISILRFKPQFSSADNPASYHSSVMVRFFTFFYLPVFNFWLLIYPKWLSFDWSMESIPLIVSLFDIRNIFTLIFYGIFFKLLLQILNYHSLVFNNNNNNVKTNVRKFDARKFCQRCETYQQQYMGKFQNVKQRSLMFDQDENNNNSMTVNYNQPLSDPNNNDITFPNANYIIDENNNNPDNPDNNNNNNQVSALNIRQKFKLKLSIVNNIEKKKRIRKKLQTETDCFLISIALMVIPFIPATNLFFYIGFVVAERILYIPSFGYCLFVSICIEKFLLYCRQFSLLKYLIYLGYFLLIIAFSVRTILRNNDWLTEENLYRAGTFINPPKGMILYYCN